MTQPKRPLLSIGIPTFNRAAWLETALHALLPQVAEVGGDVELVVSDNASTDRTPDVLRAAQEQFPFLRVGRNPSNVGFIANMGVLAQTLGRGEWLWLLGDDDIVRAGAVRRVVDVLRTAPQAEYIYINYVKWDAPDGGDVLSDPDAVPVERTGSPILRDEPIARLADLIGEDTNALTPIYSFVMRRARAQAVWDLALGREPFADLESVVPHAVYAARHLLPLPAYRIGTPLVVASDTISWSRHLPIYILYLMPQLLDRLERGGAARRSVDHLRRALLRESAHPLFLMLCKPDTALRHLFSLPRFLWRSRRLPRETVCVLRDASLQMPGAARVRRVLYLASLPGRAVRKVWRIVKRRLVSEQAA